MKALPSFLTLLAISCGHGCGDSSEPKADLPEGWSQAVRIPDFVQQDCSRSAYEQFDERAEVEASEQSLHIAYLDAHFRCAQDVEGFVLRKGNTVDVLVQPIDMHPKGVAGCDCLYNIDMDLAALEAGEESIRLYRRWDAINEPNVPVLITTQKTSELE